MPGSATIRRIPVMVSGRMTGRAAGGMADTICRRMIRQDEFTDESVEPAGDAFRRADFRHRARMVWAGECVDPDLAADVHLSPASLSDHLAQPFFGAAWALSNKAVPCFTAAACASPICPGILSMHRSCFWCSRRV